MHCLFKKKKKLQKCKPCNTKSIDNMQWRVSIQLGTSWTKVLDTDRLEGNFCNGLNWQGYWVHKAMVNICLPCPRPWLLTPTIQNERRKERKKGEGEKEWDGREEKEEDGENTNQQEIQEAHKKRTWIGKRRDSPKQYTHKEMLGVIVKGMHSEMPIATSQLTS